MNRTSLYLPFVVAACFFFALAFRTGTALGAEGDEPKPAEEKKDTPEAKDANQAKLIDLTDWSSEDEKYTNPVEAQVEDGEKGKQLKVSFKGGEKDKSVICRDLSKAKLKAEGNLKLRVANPNEKAVEVTVALKTGKNYAFHESQRVSVKPSGKEFQDIAIDLGASTFKSEATEWKNTGAIADPGEVKSIQIAIYNEKESGTLIVTDLEIAPKP
jgi:hypothetical protein